MKYFISYLLIFIIIACSNEKVKDEQASISIEKGEEIVENPTFSEHIASIIHSNCTPCHRPGEAGPFSLITYKDVKKRSETIKFVVETRYMPPWPADPSYRHFVGERYLPQATIQTIVNWIDNSNFM